MTALGKAKAGFVASEPVLAAHLASAVVGYVLAALVTHGVIAADEASALTQQIVPAVTAGMLVAFGLVVRCFVSPSGSLEARVETAAAERIAAWSSAPVVSDAELTPEAVADAAKAAALEAETVYPAAHAVTPDDAAAPVAPPV